MTNDKSKGDFPEREIALDENGNKIINRDGSVRKKAGRSFGAKSALTLAGIERRLSQGNAKAFDTIEKVMQDENSATALRAAMAWVSEYYKVKEVLAKERLSRKGTGKSKTEEDSFTAPVLKIQRGGE